MVQDSKENIQINQIQSTELPAEHLSATRSDLAKKFRSDHPDPKTNDDQNVNDDAAVTEQLHAEEEEEIVQPIHPPPESKLAFGTILEAAFVDPAYTWPPMDGQGKYAIELKASKHLLVDKEEPESTEADVTVVEETTTTVTKKSGWLSLLLCCKSSKVEEAVVTDAELNQIEEADRKRRLRDETKRRKGSDKDSSIQKYGRVPEGILIYRLDTSASLLQLVSQPHSQTNMETLVQEMHVVDAYPSGDKSRRGIDVVGKDGRKATLIACEQRTATAWLEAMDIMHARQTGGIVRSSSSLWAKEKLGKNELDAIETSYMNLANFSHKLIRAGAIPGTSKGSGGAGGIYYSVETIQSEETNPLEEEALEAIAKRRAVIKDSWDFYRMICSLLRDRAKYEEVFRKLQLDPVYPYLNSLTGLNDPGSTGRYENLDKDVIQHDIPSFKGMTKVQVANELVKQAETAMPSLVEICKALAGSLGMEEVGVGPIKEPLAAIRKAEKKYGGDILKVTDYCRALLVVKDLPSLLALLELARDSFGPLICRVKMSSLKQDHSCKPGGYRDCIINVELKGHICEIQIHLWPMWVVCGVDGFRHYRHCVEYNTDSFEDALDALDGLDRKTMAELIVVAEEAVSQTPLTSLEWFDEKIILDYFAEAGLFMKHKLHVWAEIIYRHLIRLRTLSPDIGPDHHTTITLYKYLAQCLKAQGKHTEVKEIIKKVQQSEKAKKVEQQEAIKSMWDALGDVYDMVIDPSRKEREQEEKVRMEVKQSKKRWRKIRQERFPFLDVDMDTTTNNDVNIKNNDVAEDVPPTPTSTHYEEKKE